MSWLQRVGARLPSRGEQNLREVGDDRHMKTPPGKERPTTGANNSRFNSGPQRLNLALAAPVVGVAILEMMT